MQDSYTVKEIRLLSTIFLDSNGTLVQAPNSELNKMVGYVHFLVVKLGKLFSTVHSKYSTKSPGRLLHSFVRLLSISETLDSKVKHLNSMSIIPQRLTNWKFFEKGC
jgi:hypothetical protein